MHSAKWVYSRSLQHPFIVTNTPPSVSEIMPIKIVFGLSYTRNASF